MSAKRWVPFLLALLILIGSVVALLLPWYKIRRTYFRDDVYTDHMYHWGGIDVIAEGEGNHDSTEKIAWYAPRVRAISVGMTLIKAILITHMTYL